MDSIYLNSRSASSDRFFKERFTRSYTQHMKTVQSIDTEKLHPIVSDLQIGKNLKKFKDTSKGFRRSNEKVERLKDNANLVERLYSLEPTYRLENPEYDKLQHTINHWHLRKTQAAIIREENKKLGLSIIAQKEEIKKSKKRIKKNIEEYLQTRDHMRQVRLDKSVSP